MSKVKPFIPSGIAVVVASLVSIILIEETIVILACLVVALAGLVAAGICCIEAKHGRLQALDVTIVPAVLFIAIAWWHLPLRLVFRAYRPQFDQVAAQIEAGKIPATPFWIGPFRIRMAGRSGDSGPAYLASNREKWEIVGFVRHPDGYGFNLWSCITLDDEWAYISED